jgi:NADH-quinone oxidoreductase subunit L
MISEPVIWAILLLPLASFVVISLLIRPFLDRVSVLSGFVLIGCLIAALVLSLGTLAATAGGAVPEFAPHPWLDAGGATIALGLLVDPLTAIMLVVVTGVSLAVQVYSLGYMRGDPSYSRYFAYMSLFTGAMIGLVLSSNIVQLYVFWELVGVASYLLIGFWHHRPAAAVAAKKAFIITRIGDVGFLLAILYLYRQGDRFAAAGLDPFHIPDIWQAAQPLAAGGAVLGGAALTWVLLGIFAGAAGKSGQFPLHAWLPDAMEGPTPVSALIHAATMVTAGVYMVARSNALFQLTPSASHIVAIVGAFTAIFAASIGLVQNDIKRVLAYSTVSQLGYMFLALGVGAYWVAVFHLFTHAFFKALLFLCSGSVIHAMSGEQDMRNMGALKDKIPITHWTMFVGSVAIAGIPGLAGFFSKDEILWQTFSSPLGSRALYTVGLATAGMTAFYMWRLMNMTFYGKSRVSAEAASHLHESPATMTIPLSVLAVGSVLGGWIGVPKLWTFFGDGFRLFETWLEPVFTSRAAHAAAEAAHATGEAHHDTGTEWLLMGVSVTVALVGIALARYMYHIRPELSDSMQASLRPLHKLLLNKWYVDEIYNALFVTGLSKGGGLLLGAFDRGVVDGTVNAVGRVTRGTSSASMWSDTWIVDGAVRFGAFMVKAMSCPVRLIQTGQVQSYALYVVVGVALFFGYFMAGK